MNSFLWVIHIIGKVRMDSLPGLAPRAQSSVDYHNTVTCNLIYANFIYKGSSGGSVVKLEAWEFKSQHC